MNSQPVREDTDLQHHTDTDRAHSGSFQSRHIGPDPAARDQMLAAIGVPSLDALIEQTVPPDIRLPAPLDLPAGVTEYQYLRSLRGIAARNRVFRSYIGHGYYDCVTPAVILRNVLENPGWYTPYTPYQAEIAQGRLESLLNFQTMVRDLTGMDIATASLLDEGTAAAEAMTMFHRLQAKKAPAGQESIFVVSERCFAQTIDVLRGRAEPLKIKLVIGDLANVPQDVLDRAFGILAQYPDAHGEASDLRPLIGRAHDAGCLVAVATDLLSLALLVPPGEMGADAVVGNSQRFGVPLGYGGPHAAFLATRDSYVRQAPGRIIGMSVDARGKRAYRMALQTREQHIRREKATSNICTAQALLANIAAMYAVFHGPAGIRAIAERVHHLTRALEDALTRRRAAPDQRGVFRHAARARGRSGRRAKGRRGRRHQFPLRAGRHRHLARRDDLDRRRAGDRARDDWRPGQGSAAGGRRQRALRAESAGGAGQNERVPDPSGLQHRIIRKPR